MPARKACVRSLLYICLYTLDGGLALLLCLSWRLYPGGTRANHPRHDGKFVRLWWRIEVVLVWLLCLLSLWNLFPMAICSSRRLHWSNYSSAHLPCLWILFPSNVGLVLVTRVYVYAFVGSFRNTLAAHPDVECVFLLYTVQMWPMACFCFGTFEIYCEYAMISWIDPSICIRIVVNHE